MPLPVDYIKSILSYKRFLTYLKWYTYLKKFNDKKYTHTKQPIICCSSSEGSPSHAFTSTSVGYTIDQGDDLASIISKASNCFLTTCSGWELNRANNWGVISCRIERQYIIKLKRKMQTLSYLSHWEWYTIHVKSL